MTKVPNVTFNNGCSCPILGLGTFKTKPLHIHLEQAVKDAIDAGYRHFDCAMLYENELQVGQAIKSKIGDGTVKREDLFITSKLWNTFHSKHLVIPTLKKTLATLKLDYLDLYLMHWPMGFKENTGCFFPKDTSGKQLYSSVDYVETYKGLEEAVAQGLTRSIGVSNFNASQVDRLLQSCSIVPATNQVESHPYLVQDKLLEYCKSKGIVLTAYSPLGSPDRPCVKKDDPVLLDDPQITALASKYGKTPAQLLIRFQVQRGVICIPKSITKSRIIENIQVWDFKLTEEDMKAIASFDCNGRICPSFGDEDHPYFPFNTEF